MEDRRVITPSLDLTDDKDPWESVVVEFDFTGELVSIDSATVVVTPVNGTDAGASAMLEGALQIIGSSVYQRVRNGVDKLNYKLRCEAVSGSDKRVRAGVLPVRTP